MSEPQTPTASAALAVGHTILIDGQQWIVQAITGGAVRTAHATTGKACVCALSDVVPLAIGLYGLTGRIEAPKPAADATTLSVAAVPVTPITP